MAQTKLRQRGQVTLPEEIRKAARIEVGDPFEVELTDDGILLRPLKAVDPSQQDRDPSQWWFWTPEWQAGEREASADVAAGRTYRFESGEEFLAWMDAIDAELDAAEK